MTTSRHSPSSRPCRWYTPTSRKPDAAQRRRLAAFSGNTRETSFQKPRRSHSSIRARRTARPAPPRRASRAT